MSLKVYSLGQRIDDPWYQWVTSKGIARPVFRRCRSKLCHEEWTNMEVPLVTNWEGERAQNCPVHTQTKGRVLWSMTPSGIDKRTHVSRGVATARSMGGVYRRRECTEGVCLTPITKRARVGQQTRWATIELWSTGTVQDDVTDCPRCGDVGIVLVGKDIYS